MKTILKSNEGISMILVLVILTVLTILGTSLFDSSLGTMNYIKRMGRIELAYLAGSSACEVWFDRLDDVFDNTPDIGNTYNCDVLDNDSMRWYVKQVLDNEILDLDAAGADNVLPPFECYPEADSSYVGTALQIANTLIVRLDCVNIIEFLPAGFIKARIGFVYSTNFEGFADRIAYQEREFLVPVKYNKVILDGGIVTLGDIYVSNSNFRVIGDIYSFGTYAEVVSTKNQHYNGGIMAKDKARLYVDGNVYTSSLLRTGLYAPSPLAGLGDNTLFTEIRVTRDIIAQSIHVFGDNDRIVGYRNAYTFDDLELNGANSTVAINGNFVGLERANSSAFHDNNSGIINTSLTHNILGDNSKRSAIAINGDVIIPGGSFKVAVGGAEEGLVLAQIEDAALAIDHPSNALPSYKLFSWQTGGDPTITRGNNETGYHNFLQTAYTLSGNGKGYQNMFQYWPVDTAPNDVNITNWLDTSLAIARSTWGNLGAVPAALNGFAAYEIAANESLYWTNGGGFNPVVTINDILPINNTSGRLNDGNFILDGFTNDDINTFMQSTFQRRINRALTPSVVSSWGDVRTFWNQYWEDVDTSSWADYQNDMIGFDATDIGKTLELSALFKAKVNKFIQRDFPTGTSRDWNLTEVNSFKDLFDKIESFSGAGNPNVIKISSGDYGASALDSEGRLDIANLVSAPVCTRNGSNTSADLSLQNDFYLIICEEINFPLYVNSTFNGIICSKGQVRLGPNANIYGSIVASGLGENGTSTLDATETTLFEDLASIGGTDAESVAENARMNDGEFAGLYVDTAGVGAPVIDFTCGGDEIVNDHFAGKEASFKLYQIFLNQTNSLDLKGVLIDEDPTP